MSVFSAPSGHTGWEANGTADESLLKQGDGDAPNALQAAAPAVLMDVLMNLPHVSSLAVPLKHLLAVARAPGASAAPENGCSQYAQTRNSGSFQNRSSAAPGACEPSGSPAKLFSKLFC